MVLFLLLLSTSVLGYLPGLNRNSYKYGDKIDVFAATITSDETQLPFDYYYLPFFKDKDSETDFENLGQALSGDVVEKTPYNVYMGSSASCSVLGRIGLKRDHLRTFRWMIDHNYRVNWIMDNLPAGLRISLAMNEKNLGIYEDGFPIGFKAHGNYYIYNHHHIIVKTHDQGDGEKKNIVGFLVQPFSLQNLDDYICRYWFFSDFLEKTKTFTEEIVKLDNENKLLVEQAENYFLAQGLDTNVTFTYSVAFEKSNVKWASRWDIYLYKAGGDVHWLSIINSFALVLFLTCIIGNIFRRAVGADITIYNESEEMDLEAESGWKQLKGDVFRHPVYSGMFSIIIGSGVQVVSMCFCTLIFACIGFMSPEHRGALLTTILLLFAMTGILAGLVSGRLYKMFCGEHWKKNACGTALLFPTIAFMLFFTINLLILSEESSGAVPFTSLLELLLIWFGISVPLTFLGSAIGFKHPSLINPVKVSRIPKPLPLDISKKFYLLIFLCGSLPFGSMFIELNYVMKSIWHHTIVYYLFGFLLLCFLLVAVVASEISILIVYVFLCKDDYRWWWLSVLVPGSSGMYLFLYAIYYYFTDLSIRMFASTVLYFGYMIIVSMLFFLAAGAIGFLASFIFVRRIYSMIKLE